MINSIVVVVGSRLKIEKQDKCPKGVGGGGGMEIHLLEEWFSELRPRRFKGS